VAFRKFETVIWGRVTNRVNLRVQGRVNVTMGLPWGYHGDLGATLMVIP